MNRIMTRILTVLNIMSFVLVNSSFSQDKDHKSTGMYPQYKKLFTQIDLPIDWDKRDIGKFGMPSYGIKSNYTEVSPDFSTFIPNEIICLDSITYIRALHQLPSIGNVDLFLIATDYMFDRYKEGELHSIITQLYLIAYNSSGKILFYNMIAGTAVDEWDKLVKINADYTFQTQHYKYLPDCIKHISEKHYIEMMMFTNTMGKITSNGIINCTNETVIGFFDPVPGGYELAKEIKCNINKEE